MRLMSLPDDAFSERFDGAQALERDYGVKLTRVRDFVKQQVRLAKADTTD
jgi:glycine betaine/choline ABC-type transport system substrate-binding protein